MVEEKVRPGVHVDCQSEGRCRRSAAEEALDVLAHDPGTTPAIDRLRLSDVEIHPRQRDGR